MNKSNTTKYTQPKLLTFDFIWHTGGLIILAWGFIFPIIQYKADKKIIQFQIKLGVIECSLILSIIVGLILCIIYTVYHYKKDVDATIKNVYVGTCTDEELQEAIENSD